MINFVNGLGNSQKRSDVVDEAEWLIQCYLGVLVPYHARNLHTLMTILRHANNKEPHSRPQPQNPERMPQRRHYRRYPVSTPLQLARSSNVPNRVLDCFLSIYS